MSAATTPRLVRPRAIPLALLAMLAATVALASHAFAQADDLPEVSIEAGTSPVTEGAAATFTLSRTGPTTESLTVNVSVTETGSTLSDALPTTAVFGVGHGSKLLSLATDDDDDDEDPSVVTATVTADTAQIPAYRVKDGGRHRDGDRGRQRRTDSDRVARGGGLRGDRGMDRGCDGDAQRRSGARGDGGRCRPPSRCRGAGRRRNR